MIAAALVLYGARTRPRISRWSRGSFGARIGLSAHSRIEAGLGQGTATGTPSGRGCPFRVRGTIRRLGRPRNRQWRTADGAQQGKPSLADVPPRGHEWDAEACPQPRSRTLQHCSSVRARQPRPTLLSARPRRLAMLARSACSCLVGLPKRGERQAVSRGDGMTATQPRLELDWRRAVPTALRRRLARRLRGPFPWDPGVILKPPPCPEGNVRSPPDFVGVGCQKAGTSWWFLLLAQHPGVDVSLLAHKELHYFARFWRDGFTDADAAAYATLFPRLEGKLSGEWTRVMSLNSGPHS